MLAKVQGRGTESNNEWLRNLLGIPFFLPGQTPLFFVMTTYEKYLSPWARNWIQATAATYSTAIATPDTLTHCWARDRIHASAAIWGATVPQQELQILSILFSKDCHQNKRSEVTARQCSVKLTIWLGSVSHPEDVGSLHDVPWVVIPHHISFVSWCNCSQSSGLVFLKSEYIWGLEGNEWVYLDQKTHRNLLLKLQFQLCFMEFAIKL